MASFLHRLGRWCAQHPWRTITVWVLVIAAAATTAVAFAKPMSNEFDIPGSRFQVVLEDLKEQIPDAAGSMGTVVLSSEDGFTDAERQAVTEVLGQWRAVDGVTDVVNPFDTQADLEATAEELEAGAEELEQGRAEVEAGLAQIEEGQQEIDAGRAEWEAGREQLEATRDQLPAEALARAEAELTAADEQLTRGQQQLDAGREQLETAEAELEAGAAELALGERFAALTDGLRFVSEDGSVALAQVQFGNNGMDLDPAVGEELQTIGDQLSGSGVEVDYSQAIVQDLSSIMGPAEVVGLAVAAVVLLVMLGSLVVAGLPLLMALVGVGVGVGVAMALTSVIQMNSVTPALALMLGLAVGIDYSLFLINRHRTQVREGMAVVDSVALATGTSGNAVTFAGTTVFIALAALLVTGIPFLGIMGLVAAGTILVAVLIALTLTPALLALLGRRVLGRAGRTGRAAQATAKHRAAERSDAGGGWAGTVQRHPVLAVLGVVAVVAATAFPALDIRLGLPDGASEPAGSTAYRTYDLTREHFGAGANGPIVAMATLEEPVAAGEGAVLQAQVEIAEDLAAIDGTSYVLPFGVSEDRSTLAFQVVPDGGPAEQSTVELVEALDTTAADIGADHDAVLG